MQSNQSLWIIILIVIFGSLALVAGSPSGKKGGDNLIPQPPSINQDEKSLQINSFNFITPTTGTQPAPPPMCVPDPVIPGKCCYYHIYTNDCNDCCSGVCQDANVPVKGGGFVPSPTGGAQYWCDAKPVIYLYPKEKISVDVEVTVPGKIIESIPLYPKGGWQQVIAYPNGTLNYQGKNYKELFYEASVAPITPPKTGFVIPIQKLPAELLHIVTQLGLNGQEKEEFLKFWVPKLTSLSSPYIFVSVFDKTSKTTIDKVIITPNPDTFIEFIMYYKPLKSFYAVNPLKLPEVPPTRKGFTAIEWGGIIDQ